ncbi:unnamed protein product, partial [Meganyctiphanes norvegica]
AIDNLHHLPCCTRQLLSTDMLTTTATVLALLATVSGPCLGASLQGTETRIGNISDVRYLLWTRENSGDWAYYHLHHRDEASLHDSPFQADRPTYFIVHGFQSDGLLDWILEAKTDILEQYDGNIFSVDWAKLCPLPFYIQAVENVYKVGHLTADFIDWLHEETGLAPSQVEVVGHSLGAHVSGITGKSLRSGKLARITGMDPAGPLFHNQTGDYILQPSDADFVDIIHTNAGYVDFGEIGFEKPLGDVDFFVNGGSHQAGCDPNVIGGDFLDLFTSCSHSRSHMYWVESITAMRPDPTFNSWPCDSWEEFENGLCPSCGQGCLDMGFHMDRNLKGIYYLATHWYKPFAKGDDQ